MGSSNELSLSINTQLTDVGYTTAIEYGFYAFFALCLFCVVTGLAVERLHAAKLSGLALRADITARTIYVATVLVLFVAYMVNYDV